MNEEKNKIENLKKDLYSRDFPDNQEFPRSRLSQQEFEVEKGWKHADTLGTPLESSGPQAGLFFKKILVGAAIFFVLSAALALFIFFKGYNIVSTDKINISFVGPVAIAAGDELALDIVIENSNNTPLINAIAYIDYPEGTKHSEDLTMDLNHEKEVLGTIEPLQNARRTEKSVLFGEQNARREIKVTLEYNVQGSNAVFRKEKVYELVISSSPLTLSVDHPRETISNQDIEFTVTVSSNASVPLNNLLLKAQYPFGFEYTSADPKPEADNNHWNIERLDPGQKKTFIVKGRLEGEENDERIFRFNIGAVNANDSKQIATNYLSNLESILIKKPPIALRLSFDDASSKEKEHVANQGDVVSGQIDIVNNLPIQLVDTEVRVVLSGNAFNPLSPEASQGFYRSVDKTLIWDKNSMRELGIVNPGENISFNFKFTSFNPDQINAIKQGLITAWVSVSGKRMVEGQDVETVSSFLTKTVKIQSTAAISSRLVYATGPFPNTGPIPPQADKRTTYTVIWNVSNSSNALSAAEMRAVLPPHTRFLNFVSPTNEKVAWNSEKNEVVWQIGDIPTQTGRGVKTVAFQVEVLPSLSQIGQVIMVMNNPVFEAVDIFTSKRMRVTGDIITTELSTDPKFGNDKQSGVVRQ